VMEFRSVSVNVFYELYQLSYTPPDYVRDVPGLEPGPRPQNGREIAVRLLYYTSYTPVVFKSFCVGGGIYLVLYTHLYTSAEMRNQFYQST